MDVVTALAFGYIVYTLIYSKREPIDRFLLNPKKTISEWIKRNDDEEGERNQWINDSFKFLINSIKMKWWVKYKYTKNIDK